VLSATQRLRLRLGQSLRYLKMAARSLHPKWQGTREGAHPPSAPRESELLARLEEYNAAAERQWQVMNAEGERRGYLLEKPLASLREAPAMLYRLGLALEALDLGVGHTVLDFGAGSCWLSLVLNRLRCRTISVDVSPAALAIGQELFRRDPWARPDLEPRFLPYDGRRLALEAESVDRVVCFDSFHHVPNQREVLGELFRVLRHGGRVVMAEPGEGHSHADASAFDASQYGVLENELVLADLLELARATGFSDVQVKPYPDVPVLTLSGEAHLRLLAGDHSLFPMHLAVANLRQFHVLVFLKGRSQRDSRNPGLLRARITTPEGMRLEGRAGTLATLRARVENTGDTTWLSGESRETGGYVSLGGHLFDAEGQPLRIGYFTARLPRDIAPGEAVEVEAAFGLPERSGRFTLRLDLVADRIAWFSQEGSPTKDVEVTVEWSDSRDPHRLEARIESLVPAPLTPEGGALPLRLRLANVGDTTWAADPPEGKGTVKVGVQRLTEDGAVAERDYFRIPLPRWVEPGESVEVSGRVPLPPGPASARFAVDLVAEQICWFAAHGSKPLLVRVG
jgi:SAM-dependent methyltransferase